MNTNLANVATTLMALLCSATLATAAGTPEQKCESGKNDAAGKYDACMFKARKGLVLTGDAVAYGAAATKCESKLESRWDKLEFAAAVAGTSCPSSADLTPIEDFLDACGTSVASALAGGALIDDPVACGSNLDSCSASLGDCADDLSTCTSDIAQAEDDLADCEADYASCLASSDARLMKTSQTTCYNDAGTLIPCAGSGRDGEHQAGDSPLFVDNGNGTITDYNTGLMWEKLSDDGSIHDKDNVYAGLSGAIGKANSLNSASFAGYTDWRIPNLRELGSLPNYGVGFPAVYPIFNTGCAPGCTVLTCSCTRQDIYATSTIYLGYPSAHWRYNFTDGDMYASYSTDNTKARAVRTAF
jgi:hypothetical protein